MPNPLASFSGRKSHWIVLDDFSAGSNLKTARDTRDPRKLQLLENFFIRPDGSLVPRWGQLSYTAQALGAGRVRGSVAIRLASSETVNYLVYHTTKISKLVPGTSVADSLTALSSTAEGFFLQVDDFVYFVNGSDVPQKYSASGDSWSAFGQGGPGSAATLAAGGAGPLFGTYRFKFTWVTGSGLETNGSPVSADLLVQGASIKVDAFERADNNSLGTDWTESEAAAADIKVLTGRLFVSADSMATYTGTWNNDQSSQVTYFASSSYHSGPAVRLSGTRTSLSGYIVTYEKFTYTDAGVTMLVLWKYSAVALAAGTILGSLSKVLNSSDVLKLEVIGTTINVRVNGTIVLTKTDSTVATGSPGVAGWAVTAGQGSATFSDWNGGGLSTSGAIDLSGVLVGPAGATSRRIYGFKVGVSSVYQLIGTISNNTATTYTVSTDQDQWTTTIPSDADAPPTAVTVLAHHKNRMWASGSTSSPRRLYYSKTLNYEQFPATNFIDVPMGQNDVVIGMISLGDVLLVFGKGSAWYVTGTLETEFTVIYFGPHGCVGRNAYDRVGDVEVLHLSKNGVVMTAGTTQALIADQLAPLWWGEGASSFKAMSTTYSERSTLRYHRQLNAVVMSFSDSDSTGNNNQAWWGFLTHAGWAWVHDSRASAVFVTHDSGATFSLLAWAAGAGTAAKWGDPATTTDDTYNVFSVVETGDMAGVPELDHGAIVKDWKTALVGFSVQPIMAPIVLATTDRTEDSEYFVLEQRSGNDYLERFSDKIRGKRLRLRATMAMAPGSHLSTVSVEYVRIHGVARVRSTGI